MIDHVFSGGRYISVTRWADTEAATVNEGSAVPISH